MSLEKKVEICCNGAFSSEIDGKMCCGSDYKCYCKYRARPEPRELAICYYKKPEVVENGKGRIL